MIGQEKVYETLKALGIEFDYLEHRDCPPILEKFGQYTL